MIQNQAVWERAIRVAAGVGMMAGGYEYSDALGYLSWVIMIIGAVLVATGVIAYCPAWHLMGVSTKRPKA